MEIRPSLNPLFFPSHVRHVEMHFRRVVYYRAAVVRYLARHDILYAGGDARVSGVVQPDIRDSHVRRRYRETRHSPAAPPHRRLDGAVCIELRIRPVQGDVSVPPHVDHDAVSRVVLDIRPEIYDGLVLPARDRHESSVHQPYLDAAHPASLQQSADRRLPDFIPVERRPVRR